MAIMLKSPLVIETDEDLVRVGRENAGYRFEREEDGTILVSPTYSNGGFKSAEALGQLRDYAKIVGGNVADSNTGFAIGPGVRIFCPDASWVSSERIASLTEEQRAKFWPISPDVVIEVRSQSDTFAETIAKLDSFVARGTTYAVAIDPFTREVVTRGTPPDGLSLDIDAIVDA
ncbi:MAG: Uma2 family endonuclease [Vulcanimicrobiaceae bacterium]